jgi:hypothetical protein
MAASMVKTVGAKRNQKCGNDRKVKTVRSIVSEATKARIQLVWDTKDIFRATHA